MSWGSFYFLKGKIYSSDFPSFFNKKKRQILIIKIENKLFLSFRRLKNTTKPLENRFSDDSVDSTTNKKKFDEIYRTMSWGAFDVCVAF